MKSNQLVHKGRHILVIKSYRRNQFYACKKFIKYMINNKRSLSCDSGPNFYPSRPMFASIIFDFHIVDALLWLDIVYHELWDHVQVLRPRDLRAGTLCTSSAISQTECLRWINVFAHDQCTDNTMDIRHRNKDGDIISRVEYLGGWGILVKIRSSFQIDSSKYRAISLSG